MIHSTIGRDVRVIECVGSGRIESGWVGSEKTDELELKSGPEMYGSTGNPITFEWN